MGGCSWCWIWTCSSPRSSGPTGRAAPAPTAGSYHPRGLRPPRHQPDPAARLFHSGESAVSHTVLVCDDASFMRTMISDILSQAGFEVVGEAESGLQAVDKY